MGTMIVLLSLSAALCVIAIAVLPRAVALAMNIQRGALVAGALGTIAAGLSSMWNGWIWGGVIFGGGACGCQMIAIAQGSQRPARWLHRFSIYAGYGATLAVMSLASIRVANSALSRSWATVLLLAIYVAGSGLIFLAKTLTIHRARVTMPEYEKSLGRDDGGFPGVW